MVTSPRIPRVLVLEPAGQLWGSERALLDLIHSISDMCDIAVCCPPRCPLLAELDSTIVHIYPTFIANLHHKSRLQRLRATIGLLGTALLYRPDVIHVNQAGATRIGMVVGGVMRVPTVAHVRLSEDVRYVMALQRQPSRIICISDYIRDQFAGYGGAVSERLITLYDAYVTRADSADRIASPLAYQDPLVVCVGRITPSKRQDVLLEAVKELRTRGVSVRACFLGEAAPGDIFESHLRAETVRLGIEDAVEWAGFEQNVVARIAGSAALVCPSRSEPLGRVVFEAWDAGTVPVAWQGSGGPAHVIGESGGGVLYETDDGRSLATAVQRVLSLSPEDRDEMLLRGQDWMRRNIGPEEYGKAIVKVWEEAIEVG